MKKIFTFEATYPILGLFPKFLRFGIQCKKANLGFDQKTFRGASLQITPKFKKNVFFLILQPLLKIEQH